MIKLMDSQFCCFIYLLNADGRQFPSLATALL